MGTRTRDWMISWINSAGSAGGAMTILACCVLSPSDKVLAWQDDDTKALVLSLSHVQKWLWFRTKKNDLACIVGLDIPTT